jgi:hypothetical protein
VELSGSTIEGIESAPQARAAAWSRRAFLVGLLAFVVAGGVGLLGDTTATAHASGGGYELTLEYATSSRAGLDVPWQVTVRHAGGFPGKSLTLAVTGDYFDIYETQGFHPDASDATRDGSNLYLTFNTPPGDTFVVAYDAYIQPSSQVGKSGTIAVVDSGAEVAKLGFTTSLLP